MTSPFVNSVLNPIQLMVFLAAVVLVLGAVSRLKFINVFGFFFWLFSYPVLGLLALTGTLIAFGLVGGDYGLQFCIYPDGGLTKFAAAALVMMLFCETLALSYLWDHVEYDHSPRARTRVNIALVRSRLLLFQWLIVRWLISLFPQTDDDAWLRYLGRTEIEALERRPGIPVADLDIWPGRRLKGALAVVTTQGLLLIALITAITTTAVFKENLGHVGDRRNVLRIVMGLACFTAGLPVGWLVSVAITWVIVVLIPGATRPETSPQRDNEMLPAGPRPRRRSLWVVEGAAIAYLITAFAIPSVSFKISLVFLAALSVWVLKGRLARYLAGGDLAHFALWARVRELAIGTSGSLSPHVVRDAITFSDAFAEPRVYVLSMVITYLLSCVGIILSRTGGTSGGGGDYAFILGLILSLILSVIFVMRTRFRTPDSVVAIPALFMQGYLVICIVYMFWGSASPFRLVVALPLTCLLGAGIAFFFFAAYLLPGRLATGALACLLVTAYMDGSAIDLGDSNQKLRFADLEDYYQSPVILDTRDYFTSSYGKVVRLDHDPLGDRATAITKPVHIGSASFTVNGNDLDVNLPVESALPTDRPVVIRMPRRVQIKYQRDTHLIRMVGTRTGDIESKNLKNAALLWKNPKSEFRRVAGQNNVSPFEGDRYVLFPLWPHDVARDLRDGTPYWRYAPDDTVPGAWSVHLPKSHGWEEFIQSLDAKMATDVYLVGNWYFEVAKPAPTSEGAKFVKYSIPGAAAEGFFPVLWHSAEAGRTNLGLRKLPPSGFDQQIDLQVTLTIPVPLGDYRVIKNGPGGLQVLVSMAAEGMEPHENESLTFGAGGPIHGLYKVKSCEKAVPVLAALDLKTGMRKAEARPAAILTIEKEKDKFSAELTGATSPRADAVVASTTTTAVDAVDPANTWERLPPRSSAPPDRLLENVEVLRNWKRALDNLSATTGGRMSCSLCPVVHDQSCPRRQAFSNPTEQPCGCPVRHKLVLVTVSGGGIRSAVWATTVLRRLELQLGASFPYHIRIITGASGGMVGATYYTGTLHSPHELNKGIPGAVVNPHTNDGPLETFLGDRDFLAPTASHMVFSDLPRALTLPLSLKKDRGRALEEAWQSLPDGKVFNRAFRGPGGLAADERDGWRPSLVFTPMLVEDGRRLIISNLDLGFVPRNIGAMLLEPASSLLRPQINQFGAFVDGGIEPGFDLYSLSAIEFFRLFPRATQFKVGTAARMSATFPFISPAVTLPTYPPRSVVDAGYYDNFGINLVSLWADLTSVKRWLVQNTSGVVLIQIRDRASQILRTELDFELRAPENPVSQYLYGSEVAAVTGDAVHAVYDRGLMQLGRPLNGFFNSRYAITSFRNDEQIESLNNWLRDVPATSADIRTIARSALDEALADTTPGETMRDKIEKRLGEFRLEGRAFPYTTVVFECPIEAALSWELSHAESENIRNGMGFAASATDKPNVADIAPLDYLGRDKLLCDIRHVYTESSQHLQMAGLPLNRVCFGALHNRQRLWLLMKWWKDSLPEPLRQPTAEPTTNGGK